MPRGKKAAQIELLPPEDDQSPKGRKRLVEAEHTIKYSAPVPVTIEDNQAEDNTEEDFSFVEEEKAKRRRKTAKDERDDFRRELDKLGVASVSRLKLSIDKYRHSDSDDSGTLAEKDYCVKYPVTKDHIINDDYLDVARKYGSGRYWFTLRMDNKIVRQWERMINSAAMPAGPVIQNVNPADPTSPQVFVQSDGQQAYQPMSMRDIMKGQKDALKEHLEMTKLMREAYGFAPEQSQQPPRSEDEILAGAILKQPEIIENVVGNVIKRFGGTSSKDDEPWYADVVRDAVKSGQLVQVVQVAIDRIFNGFNGLFPGRQNNGQAEMGQTNMENIPTTDSRSPGQEPLQIRQNQGPQEQPQSDASLAQVDSNTGSQRHATISAEEQAALIENQYLGAILGYVMTECANNAPVESVADGIDDYVEEDVHPFYRRAVSTRLKAIATTPVEMVIEYIKTIPNGEQVASLPHVKEWTTALQQLIREAGQEGEE